MVRLFPVIAADKDHILARLDPRTKILAALSLIMAVLLSSKSALPLAVAAFCIGGLSTLGLPLQFAWLRLAAPMGIASMLAVMQAFTTGATPLVSVSCLGVALTATREGAQHGLLLCSRALGAGSVMLLLSSSTPAYEIFLSLRWLKVPSGWVDIAMLMHRYAFALMDTAAQMVDAQRVRLGYSSVRNSLSSMGQMEGALVLGSISQAGAVYDSMRVRGYNGRMPCGAVPALSPMDRRVLCVLPLIVFSAYLFLEGASR